VKGHKYLSPRENETTLQNAIVDIGPMSVSMLATDNFKNYKDGVFYDSMCENNGKTNHAVGVK
jgi:Papain family cysteine protease